MIHNKSNTKVCVQTDYIQAFEDIVRGNKIVAIRENLVRLIHVVKQIQGYKHQEHFG